MTAAAGSTENDYMIVLDSEFVVCVDIDSTLIMYEPTFVGQEPLFVTDPYDGQVRDVYPHMDHIKLLRRAKARGMAVIVWSKAGKKWAERIVVYLSLGTHVDLVLTKPTFYIDDKPCQEWMGNREYLEEEWGM